MMKILVLYHSLSIKNRKTIDEHLYSFRTYDKKNKYFYINVAWGLPLYITLINFDCVILHYTMLSLRWYPDYYRRRLEYISTKIANISCVKLAFPQDEYDCTAELCDFFKKSGVDIVFTCSKPCDYRSLYPEKLSGIKELVSVYTGYVDDGTLTQITETASLPNSERPIDIGYRARKLPFWIGRHGQLKYILGRVVQEKLAEHTDMTVDISTNPVDVFKGEAWVQFLTDCRVALGCLGGSSLLDFDGSIRQKIEKYVAIHPRASFDEVERECFPALDGNISVFALSPRHFECAMTRTCQALVEGDYQGVMRPGIDFIEIKKDFSNIDDVVEQIKDKKHCEEIANNCYEHVVSSGEYSYSKFVQGVIEKVESYQEKHAIDLIRPAFRDYFLLPLLKMSEYSSRIKIYLFVVVKGLYRCIWEKK